MRLTLLLAVMTSSLLLVPSLAKPTPTSAGQGSVRVQITYVEMSRADVRALSVITPPDNAFHNDLALLENAAHRAHVSYIATDGPVLTSATGTPAYQGDIEAMALSVRYPRAFVRVGRVQQSMGDSGDTATRIVGGDYLYKSGETRRIAGEPLSDTRYRYLFATVTVVR